MPKIHPLLSLIFLIFSIVLISVASLAGQKSPQNSIKNFFRESGNIFHTKDITEEKIAKIIKNAIATQDGRWAIYVKDLNRQKTYEVNSQETFPSASLYKLGVMYDAYDAVENNRLTLDETLTESKSELDATLEGIDNANDISLPQNSGTIAMPASEALKLMITISDNYSALLLAQRLGWENIDQLMEKEGFGQIDLISQEAPAVSTKAVGDLLERIYSNKAVSQNASEEMRQLLFAQKINDRIPKYLPRYAKVGHKTGELDGLRHDAAIIYGKNSNYIFVFLSETQDPIRATEQIAQLAKTIFEELERQ